MQLTTRRTLLIAAVATLIVASGSRAQNAAVGDPKGWFSIPLDQVRWSSLNDGSPRQVAYLVGDRKKVGLYIQLVRWPPHSTAKAHTHPDERYVVVLFGTFYHGHGDKFEAAKLEKRAAGTFFTEPAHVAHFGATKDEGAVLYFVGTGPSTTDQVEK